SAREIPSIAVCQIVRETVPNCLRRYSSAAAARYPHAPHGLGRWPARAISKSYNVLFFLGKLVPVWL
ncbi:hypothetical protein, partial [Burkholderia perseverans]|uniref:hypothetical protein n=1 Tax=Burkholderia perseverans TaxID=2615214 RepID=UPI001FEF530C